MRSVRHILGSEKPRPNVLEIASQMPTCFRWFLSSVSGVFPYFFKAPGHLGPQKAVPARPLVSPDSNSRLLGRRHVASLAIREAGNEGHRSWCLSWLHPNPPRLPRWREDRWSEWPGWMRDTVQSKGLGTCQDQRKGPMETETILRNGGFLHDQKWEQTTTKSK